MGAEVSRTKSTILIAGGAGYIGSHAVLALQQAGYETVILDNLVSGHRDLVENVLQTELIVGNVGDRSLLERIFAKHSITAVMHFAAYAYVGESCREPAKYYRNNVAQTIALLEAMKAASINKLVFSSTCASYGIPEQIPVSEATPQHPLNPYGASKLMCERMIQDFAAAHGLKSVIFRFFNAAGADYLARLGEDHTPEPHLIPSVMLAALGQRESISIFGTDYPTRDGTCIRDYIHVSDLATAHVRGLEYLLEQNCSNIFNLGNERGFSVREIVDMTEKVTEKKIKVIEDGRRPGDPPVLVANSDKARSILHWKPQYPDLEDILTHAWNWHQKRHASDRPLVSVIIPAYNAERFIDRTIHSVLAQTYENLEVIVVDDGSSDRTAEIVKSIAQTDSRLIFLQQSNSGVAAARNLAIARSRGEFIAPIDADDIWYPQNIERQVECFERSDSNVGLVYSWSVDINEDDELMGEVRTSQIEGQVYQTLMLHNFMGNASCCLIRRACLEQVGYNPQLREQNAQGGEDWELYLHIAEQYQFRVVPAFLVGYRKFSNSMSCNYQAMAKAHYLIWQTIRQKHPHIPNIIYRLSSSSFYLYLARQSHYNGDHKSTLHLAYQALRTDSFTPWLRPGFYALLITNYLKVTGLKSGDRQKLPKLQHPRAKTLKSLCDEHQPITTRTKVLVENILHQSIPRIFGTTQSWR